MTAQQLVDRVLTRMQAPSARSLQMAIGPSNVGDACDRCLGVAMAVKISARHKKEDRFNLLAWQGTAYHKGFEDLVGAANWKGISTEKRVSIGKVKGYGKVSGSIDLYSEKDGSVGDYKFRYKDNIRRMKAAGVPPIQYRRQVHLYGYGVEMEGLPIEEVCLLFIPRDSMDVREIWPFIEPYDRQIALDAIKRAELIWKKFVVPGKLELLKSDRHCYSCSWSRNDVVFVETES